MLTVTCAMVRLCVGFVCWQFSRICAHVLFSVYLFIRLNFWSLKNPVAFFSPKIQAIQPRFYEIQYSKSKFNFGSIRKCPSRL